MKDINTNLLRHHEREERKENLKREEWLLNHPKVEDKNQVRKNIDVLKSQLNGLSPEPLTPLEKDKLYKLEKRLANKIAEGMPTDETMRKNPVGAVHAHRSWEKANKKLINWWKNVRIQLNPDSDDKDLANVERLRRTGQFDRMRTDAQIGGHMSYGNVPEELWPFEAPENTAAKQAERVARDEKAKLEQSLAEAEHIVETREPIELETGKRKRHISPERKQQLREQMALARQKRMQNIAAGKQASGPKPFQPVD